MTTATIGTRFQVVIPAKERKGLALEAHQKVLIEQRYGEIVIRPLGGRSFRGITKTLQVNQDPVDYVAKLRAEWNQRS
jgi:AbrB family looped-hinge helix DNA binding protein